MTRLARVLLRRMFERPLPRLLQKVSATVVSGQRSAAFKVVQRKNGHSANGQCRPLSDLTVRAPYRRFESKPVESIEFQPSLAPRNPIASR
jgi:hypothetical protein